MRRFFILTTIVLALSGCEHFGPGPQAKAIDNDMRRAQVLAVLGAPSVVHQNGELEAWEYCRLGYFADDYTVVWLRSGQVIGKTEQTDWEFGHCNPNRAQFDWANVPS